MFDPEINLFKSVFFNFLPIEFVELDPLFVSSLLVQFKTG